MPRFLDRLAEARQAELRKIAEAQELERADVAPYVSPIDEQDRKHELSRTNYENGHFPHLLARLREITGVHITFDYHVPDSTLIDSISARFKMALSTRHPGDTITFLVPDFPATSYVVKVDWPKDYRSLILGYVHQEQGFYLEFHEHDMVGHGRRRKITRSSNQLQNSGLAEDVLEVLYRGPLTLAQSISKTPPGQGGIDNSGPME